MTTALVVGAFVLGLAIGKSGRRGSFVRLPLVSSLNVVRLERARGAHS